jgi:HD-GYP domain-containing protein (c-di-GMP phosphodiesterase class II)
MRYTQLAVVKHRVAVGEPLPFNVYNNDYTLLLARGQVVDSATQMEALFTRGMLVDLAELHRGPEGIKHAPAQLLPTLWTENLRSLHETLRSASAATFRAALDEATEPVVALIERDPDLAIFQVLRQEGNEHVQYGVNHATHCAIVARLVAHRLGWSDDEATRAFKAALTMNLSMLELQGILAAKPQAPTEEQRRLIHTHPLRSREMLTAAGVADADWLLAVEQHHEEPDRSGYPFGIANPSELATLLRKADVYMAKLSPRANRESIAADRAGRELFMRDPANPITAAIVKEFGVYPPGCFVMLASGETGVVVRRGPTVMAPVVAVMTARSGTPISEPLRRDTSQSAFAITSVLPAAAVRARIAPEKLAALAQP